MEWVSEYSVLAIIFAQLASIIDGLAWLLVEQLGSLGRYGANPELLAYAGTDKPHTVPSLITCNFKL
ncbi:hypothetical protein BOTNAR_0736g00010 [Botryotinia narcissicola]|uniref:Uncharacterized protein n=1 Tax=Botryotinia narcissicola TaxID=278944 RepID=A0A4Z1HI15_9HELO|nr:hypothetical protein BOTNAR_0736g00010 [Botryotinia narcissicola]